MLRASRRWIGLRTAMAGSVRRGGVVHCSALGILGAALCGERDRDSEREEVSWVALAASAGEGPWLKSSGRACLAGMR